MNRTNIRIPVLLRKQDKQIGILNVLSTERRHGSTRDKMGLEMKK